MIVIEDGRKSFTQWDKGIYVLIDEGCDSIDVSRSDKKISRNVKVQKAGSVFRAAVPDALLTEAGYLNISCIAEEKDGNRTISTYRFRITPRAKPENYAFGHEELGNWKSLILRMNALERAAREGQFDGAPGVGVQAVEPYLTAEMSGFENVYHVILTNGQIFELRVNNGRDGKAGAEGNGIVRIEPVSLSTESGGQSIYRIFYSDGSTFDYSVYNGKDGEKGESIASVTIEKIEEQEDADPLVTKSYVMRIIESDESTVRYNAPQEKTEEERMIAQYNVGILSSVSGVAKTENEDFKINILDGLQIRQNAGTVYLLGKKYEFKGEVRTFANSTSGRRTAMFFRLNKTDNSIIGYWKGCKTDVAGIVTISGSETLPVRNDQYFDVVIAYVDIPAGTTQLTEYMIHDLRGDPAYCGYVEYTIGGGGSGDMLKSVYDPNNKAKDIFKYAEDISKLDIKNHEMGGDAHSDIRNLITGLTNRMNALADSDDETLDQLSEIVAYIKSNKSLIDSITTNKVSVSDIVDNLTTSATNKPLSAAQGKALKALIDAITIPEKLPNPNALTFTGAVTGSYDGSAPVTVNIPSGGSGGSVGGGWELVSDTTLSEDVSQLEYTDLDCYDLRVAIYGRWNNADDSLSNANINANILMNEAGSGYQYYNGQIGYIRPSNSNFHTLIEATAANAQFPKIVVSLLPNGSAVSLKYQESTFESMAAGFSWSNGKRDKINRILIVPTTPGAMLKAGARIIAMKRS